MALLQAKPLRIVAGSRLLAGGTSLRSLSSITTSSWSYPPSASDVSNDEITRLSTSPRRPLTLADLLRHGRPPLTRDALLASANFTLSLLPARLACRIQALRNLPFIVVSNPHISQIYNNYLHSFTTLVPFQKRRISTAEEEKQFTEIMADLVQTHDNTIPVLARGFLECRKYISPAEVTAFLDEHLRARIGTRLIAQQHLALHHASLSENGELLTSRDKNVLSNYIGVIDTALKPARLIKVCEEFVAEICELKYGVRPRVVINGEPEATFAHIPVHVEYILTELLKNAFRATVEAGNEREPIEVTIASAPNMPSTNSIEQAVPELEKSPNSLGTGSQNDFQMSMGMHKGRPLGPGPMFEPLKSSAQSITIRIRDRGGGIPPEILSDIWSYSYSTFNSDELPVSDNGNVDALNAISGSGGHNASTIAGLGYGLPLGRAYAEYFGGGIDIQSLWGWGTDVYLTLQGVGKVQG
ncbi:kinase isozyme 4 [Trichophyton equinum CBS 127.97]|uniref:Protein-serine/threonine kinase n=1 Tax=Trichophyton equinum (strain ATCC MYA-4606 / CBS 127.97) TaxID=559882 RepID=F2PJX2_TRIEC|nr:kinase isozyme 4 [Trichophyton equinum CBS 127.97]